MSSPQTPASEQSSLRSDSSRILEKSNMRFYSMSMGAVVGVFMQLSTLGVNFLVLSSVGRHLNKNHKIESFALPIAYSVWTLTFALVLLTLLRNILSVFHSVVGVQSATARKRFLELVVMLECRFIMGALLGVCTSWVATDIVLGLERQVTIATIVLLCALFCSCCFRDALDEDETEDSDIPTPNHSLETEYVRIV